MRRSFTRPGYWITIVLLLLSVSLRAIAQTQPPPDIPSGFFPGDISVFAGGGGASAILSDGGPAVSSGTVLGPVAADSKGNVYIANPHSIAIVYSGALPIPPVLAAVTTQANPAITPLSGHIYYNAIGWSSGFNSEPAGLSFNSGLPANLTEFAGISALAFDSSDNLYVVDGAALPDDNPSVVRKIDASTGIATIVAGQLFKSTTSTADLGDGGPATSATLNFPAGISVDGAGNLYIVDEGNNVVRVVYAGATAPVILSAEGISPSKGFIYTVAGQFQNYCFATGTCGYDVPATSATFSFGVSAAVDNAGNLYVMDNGDPFNTPPTGGTVRLVYAGGTPPPILSTVTSTPTPGNIYTVAGTESTICSTAPCGDGGLALNAAFNDPSFVTVDGAGNIYVADSSDNTVRKIDFSGYISDIAGVETPGLQPPIGAETGPATSVNFSLVTDFAFDSQNNLYVLDASHGLLWQAAPLKSQKITFNALEDVTYGVGPITLSATADSNLPVSYTATGPATVSGSGSGAELIITGAGAVTVTASQAGNSEFAAATGVSQSFTVNPATLTVSAQEASRIFNTPNPTFTALISGFVKPDTAQSVLTGTPAFTTTANLSSNVGSYPITVMQGSLAFTNSTFQANYMLSFVPGVLVITGATPQTLTFRALAPVTYGQVKTIQLTASTTSQLAPVYTSSNPAVASISGSTLTILGAGTTTLTATQPGNDTYAAATPVTQTLTINPAPLTVTGPVFSLPVGSTITPTTFPPPTISGFVGSDTQASVMGSPQYTTTASSTSAIGNYPVQVTQGTLQLFPAFASNYVFAAFSPGTLTLTGKAQSINFVTLYDSPYGTILNPAAMATSGLPVTFVVSGAPAIFQGGINTTIPSSGSDQLTLFTQGIGALTITATQPGNSEYAAAPPISQTINITKAPLTILANSLTREFGAQNPNLTYQIGSGAPINGQGGPFVNGDTDIPSVITGIPEVTTTATPSSPPGTYPITISAGTLAAPNYQFAFISGTLTILPAGGYTITSNPASLTIPRGQSRQATITITPVNLYQGTVTLSCGQLPANVTCIFSPSTYTFTGADNIAGNGANVAVGTLTINTVGGETVVGALPASPTSMLRASLLLLPGILTGFVLMVGRKRFARYRSLCQICMLVSLAIGALGLTSCGGGSSMLPYASPGTTSIVVTGTGTDVSGSGSVSSSMNLSITIQ